MFSIEQMPGFFTFESPYHLYFIICSGIYVKHKGMQLQNDDNKLIFRYCLFFAFVQVCRVSGGARLPHQASAVVQGRCFAEAGMYRKNHWIPAFACLRQAGQNNNAKNNFIFL